MIACATRLRLRRLGFVAISLVAAADASGQEVKSGPLPIDLTILPAKVMPAGTVTISGTTGLVGNNNSVTLNVVGPNGGIVATLAAKPSATGTFSTTFAKTTSLGKYRIDATAPDGKAKASASFSVVPAAELPADIARKADSLNLLAARVVEIVRKGIEAMPVSPAREESRARVAKAEAEVAKLPAQVAVLRQQMTNAFDARSKIAKAIPEWDDYTGQLANWGNDADAARQKLEAEAEQTAAATEACSDLDRYNEMLTFTSEALKLVHAPFDLTASFFSSKIPGGLIARSGADGISSPERFALVQSMKLATAVIRGPAVVAASVPAFIVDAAQFLLKAGFAKYCEKWEGPIKATFLGESFTKQGEPFFDYTIELEGKLMLLYGKNAPAGAPVKLKGYIDGTGRFDVRDNPKPIARLVPGQVLFHRVTSPPGGSYWNDLGMATRSMFPYSFRVPVTGIMAGDSILITVEAAANDFSDVIKGVSTWVILPLGSPVPQVLNVPMSLQKAQPIIERVVRRHPVLKIATSGKVMTAQGTFSRDTTNADKTARVRTTLTIKACNPGCVPLPLTPGKKP